MKRYYIAMLVMTFITLGTLVGVFMIWESPAEARLRRIDETYSQTLYDVKNYVDSYYYENNELPKNIQAGMVNTNYEIYNKANIKYKVISNNKYELCAVFNKATNEQYKSLDDQNMNNHMQGENCYSFNLQSNNQKYNNTPVGPTEPLMY